MIKVRKEKDDTMNTNLEELLVKIDETTDPVEREAMISEAFKLDHHDPRVLNLAAENTEDPYERLGLLDHSLRHARHDLTHSGVFTEEHFGKFAAHPEGKWYISTLALRFFTFVELQYDYQAMADLNEILYLDETDFEEVKGAGMLVSLRINNLPFAQSVYNDTQDHTFEMDFPYAVLLHMNGNNDEAVSILKKHLENTPNFKTILSALAKNEEIEETVLAQSEDILRVVAEAGPYLSVGLIEALQPFLN